MKIGNIETITNFSEVNRATSPSYKEIDNITYFCSELIVTKILATLPNKTSTGTDNIPSIILKHLPPAIVREYTIIFNNALNHCYFPKDWKIAKVLPIIKSNKPTNQPTNYRPISLTPCISKVFEAIIGNSIDNFTSSQNIISNFQFGFRYNHSTNHAINKLLNDINIHIHNNKIVAACLIDLEKAFDSVWINGLIYLLITHKCPSPLIDTIYDMITGKKFITYNGSQTSTITFSIQEGLQQGTVNSPKLFNFYNNKILKLFHLNENNNTCNMAFADDEIVYIADEQPTIAEEQLQLNVNKINNHYKNWNLRINPSKCETIVFHKPLRFINPSRRTGIRNFQIHIRNLNTNIKQEVPNKKLVKYLGLHIDYLAKLNEHINIQLRKASMAYKKCCRIFFNKNLEAKAKIICYQLLVRPIITYAAPMWWNTNAATMEKIRRFERNCLRQCLNMYRTPESEFKQFYSATKLYRAANIPRIDAHMIKICRDYYAGTKDHMNPIVQSFSIDQMTTHSGEKWLLSSPSVHTF